MFKINLHVAKTLSLYQVEKLIRKYPPQFSTPKYLLFMKTMLTAGWAVKLHEVKVSKYVFVKAKDGAVYKIRFSNHKPLYGRELENDCDFYVGISHKQVSTTEQITKKLVQKHP